MSEKCCPGDGTMAHVRGCVNHPESTAIDWSKVIQCRVKAPPGATGNLCACVSGEGCVFARPFTPAPVTGETTDAGVGACEVHVPGRDRPSVVCAACRATAPAEPDAGDVEALARALHTRHVGFGYVLTCYDCRQTARAVFASDWLDAVRRKAGDDRAEQIAQAIEALYAVATTTSEGMQRTCAQVARIARESR